MAERPPTQPAASRRGRRRRAALAAIFGTQLGGWRRFAAVLVTEAVGTGMFLPVKALYGHLVIGLSFAAVGAALTAGGLIGVAVTPMAGRLIDRLGAARVQLACIGLEALGYVTLAVAHGVVAYALAVAIAEAGNSAVRPATQSFISEHFRGEARRAWLAASRALKNAGLGVGSLIATAVVAGSQSAETFRIIAVINAGSGLLALGLLWPMRRAAVLAPPAAAQPAVSGVWRDRVARRLLVSYLPIILYAPVLAVALPADIVGHLHRDAWLLPALTALNTVIVVLVQVPLTSALRRHGDVAVLRLGALLLAASYAMFLTAGLGVAVDAVLVVAAVVYTFGEVLGSSPAQSALATLAPLGMTGRYLAALQLSSGLARASAPVIFGLCLTVGRGALWLSLTGLLLASALALGRQRADSQHRFETAAAQLADVA